MGVIFLLNLLPKWFSNNIITWNECVIRKNRILIKTIWISLNYVLLLSRNTSGILPITSLLFSLVLLVLQFVKIIFLLFIIVNLKIFWCCYFLGSNYWNDVGAGVITDECACMQVYMYYIWQREWQRNINLKFFL